MTKLFYWLLGSAAVVLAGSAHAQTATYTGWTDIDGDPSSTQSTGNAATTSAMEIALQRGRMRPVRNLRERDIIRRLSKPVGRLVMVLSDGRYVACTASVISENLILTNRHFIVDNPQGKVVLARLRMGYLRSGERSGNTFYSVRLAPRESSAPLDYAIHQVEGHRLGDDPNRLGHGHRRSTINVRAAPPRWLFATREFGLRDRS